MTKLTLGHVSKYLIQTTKMVAGIISPHHHEVALSFSVNFTPAIIDWREYHAVDRFAPPQTRGGFRKITCRTTW